MARKKKLDWDRSYGKCMSITPTKRAFSQDGMWFDSQGEYIEDIEGYVAPAKAEKQERKAEALERAEDILGDLGPSPHEQAARENAAAAEAEKLADDV